MRSDMQEQITITDRPTPAAILCSVFNVTVLFLVTQRLLRQDLSLAWIL